ncbi:MAG: response regulator transcription factor [Candidatus Aminicenantales bacterium]
MKVFIVDDAKILREKLIRMIEDLPGIEVAGEAWDVEEAVESIQRVKPDVVILDIKLGQGSGIDVLSQIKKEDGPIVIVFTNYPFIYLKRKCMDEGADYFFDKSTEFEKLIDVLKKLKTGSQKP